MDNNTPRRQFTNDEIIKGVAAGAALLYALGYFIRALKK